MMFLVLNRLRGTIGAYAKVNGLLIAYLVLLSTGNVWASLAGLGYIVGETVKGWGDEVGDITKDGVDDDGASTESLTWRGAMWFAPTFLPLLFIGVSPLVLLVLIAVLAFGFPICAKLGYWSSTKWNGTVAGISINGGWEHQEVWYGFLQDLTWVGLIIYLWLGV